jgi:hypothetical protein
MKSAYSVTIMALINSTTAQRIADEIFSSYNEKIISISIIDAKGGGENFLATKSTESFEKTFGVLQEGRKYGGTLAIAALGIANEVREVAGETKAITTTYERCKMTLIPIPSYEILVGFVLERRAILAEDRVASHIENLVSDNANATTTTTTNPPK